MNVKRSIGILLFVIGIFVIFYSNYLKSEIAAAGGKAYSQIEMGNRLFGGNPVGGTLTKKLKKKTAAEIEKYSRMVQTLQVAGIIVTIVGGGMAILCNKKTRRKK